MMEIHRCVCLSVIITCRLGFMLPVVDLYITESTSRTPVLHLSSSAVFVFQAGAEVGREAREEHVAEGAPAQQAAEREGQQPGQRAVSGHTLPPTGRRGELQSNPKVLY